MKYILILVDMEDGTTDVAVAPLSEHNINVLGNINEKFVFDADDDEHAKRIGPDVVDRILKDIK